MLELKTQAAPAAVNRRARRAARGQARKAAPRAVASTDTSELPPLIALLREGSAHQAAGRLPHAEFYYRKALALEPNCGAAHFGLASLATRLENHLVAYDHLKQAVTLEPERGSHWKALGRCLTAMAHYQAAVIACENALAREQNDLSIMVELAWAYYRNGQFAEALQTYGRAMEIDPKFVPALLGKGHQLYALGEKDSALACFEQVLKIDPACAEAYFRMVLMVEAEDLPALIQRAEKLVAAGAAPETTTTRLHFAIGRGHRRLQNHDKAFEAFAAGNAAIREKVPFNREDVADSIDQLIEGFQPDVFEKLAAAGSDTQLPVFIVGMPRSGSTLVEQIISSHPDVADAGEFPKLAGTATYLAWRKDGQLCYPRDIAQFDAAPLSALGEDYLEALRLGQPQSALRITDKLLSNFLNLGLIRILFPRATIIHCRRDPMDTCLSCFTQMFTAYRHLAYTNDLSDLGFYFRQYERLMAHWRTVLPGELIEIDYEEMVARQEPMSRMLIEKLGLPWNDACLEFYKAERSVRTASVAQVRSPVYKNSVEGWRKYETHLGPLREALAHGA